MFTLFHTPGTCSTATYIMLEEIGAEYEIKTVSFADNDQKKPNYLALNPKGKVPALITEQGVLTETPAILLYLAQCYPAADLAPLYDIYDLAQVQSFNSFLSSTVHISQAHRFRGIRWANNQASIDDMIAKVPENMRAHFTLIEETLIKGPWVSGESYSINDIYLFTLSRWLRGHGIDVAEFPRVNEIYRRMKDRPAVQKALKK